MGIEIERKFLVVKDDWRAQATRQQVMRQGYMSGEGGLCSIRVRLQGEPEVVRALRGSDESPSTAGRASPRGKTDAAPGIAGRGVSNAEARLNIKAAVIGSARTEFDYEIPLKDGHEILDTLCVGLVDKTRHYVDAEDGLTWEIDEFEGANAGLIVAELELRHVDQHFVKPAWLGRELTEERRYYNHALALHPYRDWPASARD